MTILYCDEFNCKFNKQENNKEARCIKLIIHSQKTYFFGLKECIEMECR